MRRAIVALVALLAVSPATAGEASDVAALNPSLSLDPSPSAKPSDLAANPFGLPALSALSATRERPLFSASRRPPPVIAAAPEGPAAIPQPEPEAPPEPKRAPFTLVGTMLGPGQGIAWLQDGSQAMHKMREGQEEAGWVLRSVGARSVVFEKSGVSETIALPKSAQASSSTADANGDPAPFTGSLPSSFQPGTLPPVAVVPVKAPGKGDDN